jgi:hypothetical protein
MKYNLHVLRDITYDIASQRAKLLQLLLTQNTNTLHKSNALLIEINNSKNKYKDDTLQLLHNIITRLEIKTAYTQLAYETLRTTSSVIIWTHTHYNSNNSNNSNNITAKLVEEMWKTVDAKYNEFVEYRSKYNNEYCNLSKYFAIVDRILGDDNENNVNNKKFE